MDMISLISARVRCRPIRQLRDDKDARFHFAEWELPSHRLMTGCQPDHILMYRTDGAVTASKRVGTQTLRTEHAADVVTLIPSAEEAEYRLEDRGRYLELYVAPGLVREFCERNVPQAAHTELLPCFAEPDQWLTAFFGMLYTEMQQGVDAGSPVDRLLLGQARELLLCHLVRRHGALRPAAAQSLQRPAGALRPHLVRRVVDFVEARLSADISLAELAALVHVSERHFIRAFRAATGRTPYQYVLERRLSAAAQLLRSEAELSIAQVAVRTGFRSQAHFTARFRERYALPPARFRRGA